MTKHRLVVIPETTFAELARRIGALGWRQHGDPGTTSSLLPGEPHLAHFRHSSGRASLIQTFNPVVHLRVLEFSGEDATRLCQEARRTLPTLGCDRIRRLLGSDSVREQLLGIFAAGELQELSVIDAIAPLRADAEPAVAGAASSTFEKLSRSLISTGARALVEEQATHPDRSTIFPRLGGAHSRRQILRWLLHDRAQANDEIERTLRTALGDEDWEVRATAMLAVARYRLSSLWPDIRGMALPRTTRGGLSKDDRDILLALRKAVLAHLRGERVPQDSQTAAANVPRGGQEMWRHLLMCVSGEAVDCHDRVFLLTHALTTRFDPDGPAPASLPDAIVCEDGGHRLSRASIALRWVPPVPHWLGSGEPDLCGVHPIVQLRPAEGFFISEHPGREQLSFEAATNWCDELCRTEGIAVTLPSAEQWEMAARGPDGRRHPWGNGFEGDPATARSPWDITRLFVAGEWTSSLTASGQRIVMGVDRDMRCAARRVVDAGHSVARYGVRCVVTP